MLRAVSMAAALFALAACGDVPQAPGVDPPYRYHPGYDYVTPGGGFQPYAGGGLQQPSPWW